MISVQCSECQSDRNSDKRGSAAGATVKMRRYPNAWTLAVDHVHVCNKEIVTDPLAVKRNHSHRDRHGRPCLSRLHSFTCATATLYSVFAFGCSICAEKLRCWLVFQCWSIWLAHRWYSLVPDSIVFAPLSMLPRERVVTSTPAESAS